MEKDRLYKIREGYNGQKSIEVPKDAEGYYSRETLKHKNTGGIEKIIYTRVA